jgi:hypothetical protein
LLLVPLQGPLVQEIDLYLPDSVCVNNKNFRLCFRLGRLHEKTELATIAQNLG